MIGSYWDPPEGLDFGDCPECGECLDLDEDGNLVCQECGLVLDGPDGPDGPDPEFPDDTDDLGRPAPSLCPHGHDWAECNACMIASDLAYDAHREGHR